MAFKRPALFTEIDPVDYQAQINLNFRKIDEAFVVIQNDLELLLAKGTTSFANLNYVDQLLKPNGPVGHDSFELDFVLNGTDQVWTVQLNRSTPDGLQQAVIQDLLHQFDSSTRPTLDVTAAAPSGDGPHRMIIGLKSEGAPQMRAVIKANAQPFSTDTQDTDFVDVVLYEFLYEIQTDGPIIHTVRRVAQPILSNSAFQRIENKVETMSLHWQGLLPVSDEDFEPFFLIPYDCEVVEGSAILTVGPQDGEVVELRLLRFGFAFSRSEDVLAHSFKWGSDTDAFPAVTDDINLSPAAVQTIPGLASGFVQLLKDDFVNFRFDLVDGIASGNFTDAQARDLTVQLRIRRISHEPRRLIP